MLFRSMSDVFALLNPVSGDNVGHVAHVAGYIGIVGIVFLLKTENRKKMLIGLLINTLIIVLTLIAYNLRLLNMLGI